MAHYGHTHVFALKILMASSIRHLFHGTQYVEMQIALSICVQQKIPELIPLLPPHSGALQFFGTLTSKERWSRKREIVLAKSS